MTSQQESRVLRRPRRALVYGDVNLNLIDGSAIWTQTIVQVLAMTGCKVTLVLKAPVHTDRLVAPINRLESVTVVRPFEENLVPGKRGKGLPPAQVLPIMRGLDEQEQFDLVVVRGLQAVKAIVDDGAFDGRLWTYLTDMPQTVSSFTTETKRLLSRVATASRFMLCQTEELRCFLESLVPAACGKCVLFGPVVPPLDFTLPRREPLRGRPIRLIYTGKFAPHWNTYEMTQLPERLGARGVKAELHMVGDKIHDDRGDTGFSDRMRTALESTRQVVWHGGMARQEAMEVAASADVGLSWRHASLNASLELSTKVLEFGALDLPVLLNRTPMHEALLGTDYPLFAHDELDVVDVIELAVKDTTILDLAVQRCRAVAAHASLDVAVERIRSYLDRAFPTASALAGRTSRLRVGVAGHDFKFFSQILNYMNGLDEIELRVDHWPSLSENDSTASKALLDWADVIIAEWCAPVAVWYSERKRPHQRLIVRLHRFELYRSWPAQVTIDNIDQVVCVSPHYAQLTRAQTGWPAEKVVVIPNWVDIAQFNRPKLEGSQFHLGFIGMAPTRKRMDLALDALDALRRRDDRYRLFVKTKMTWDYWWIWNNQAEREHVDRLLQRMQTSPHLRNAVSFDQFGPDVPTWLRRVGFILSTSDDESFHLAPAEGMASAAVPMILNWPGAETIYDEQWIHSTPEDIAEAIYEIVSSGRWDEERRVAFDSVSNAFPLDAVCDLWARLLVENLPPETAERSLMSA